MKRNILIIAAGLLSCASFISCTKDNTKTTYSGPDLIEFYPLTKTVYTSTVETMDSAVVQLVSAQASTNRNFTYAADATSTAAAPADYEFTGTSAIPAGSSFGAVYFKVKPSASGKNVKVTLTGGDNLSVAQNYKTATVNFTATPVIFVGTGTTTSAVTKSVTPPAAGINDTVRVRLNNAAARFGVATPITYTVNASSTAVEGVDYTFVTPKGTATVPAGSADGLIVINAMKPLTQKKLILDITTTTGISLATATRKLEWTINP
jgi:hypothetical protein